MHQINANSFGLFQRILKQMGWLPTDPFTISEPQNQEIGELYEVQESPATDFVARKL